MANKFRKILFALIVFYGSSFSQEFNKENKIRLAPGPQYKASSIHELIFGEHWRDLWVTPVDINVLDLSSFDGGLTALEKGGGMQTKSLRLKSGNNNIWKFRSLDKDPSKVLPRVLRETIAADVLQDQISSANPLAALVVSPILDSAGVLQAKPYLVYLPDDDRLGEFRQEFGGLVGMIELHPKVDADEGISFAGAEKIVSTFDLFDRLAHKHSEKYDSKEFLKARLIDIFLGDWDRHSDQWKWAKYEVNGIEYWKPIPRDRDQAFAKFDGWAVRIAEYLVPQFNHFDYTYPQIEDITWSGRFLDRRILPVLTELEWDSVTFFVQRKLSDNLIKSAIKELPPEHYALAGNELESKLISRRDQLIQISKGFYYFINDVVDVYCSDDNDSVYIERMKDSTRLKLFRTYSSSGNKKPELYFNKEFQNDITSEIRIYMMDGDDKVFLRGECDESPLIRIIGGDGADEITDSSEVYGYFACVTPFPEYENKTLVYDSGKKTKINFGAGTEYDDTKIKDPENEFEKYEPQLRDRHSDWLINPVINISSDNGLFIGGGPQLYKYNFRADPFDYWMTLTAYYATKPKTGTVEFKSKFNSVYKGLDLNLNMYLTGLTLTNYYGFGNNTTYDHHLDERDYYQLEQGLFIIDAQLEHMVGDHLKLGIGASVNYSDIELPNKILLNSFNKYKGSDYGLGIQKYFRGNLNVIFDSRDNEYNTLKGVYFNINFNYVPGYLDVTEDYNKIEFDLRVYQYLPLFSDLILAARIGGGKTFGNYPFYDAQFLGGSNNLRGFNRERFSGDAMLFGQFELRALLGEVRLIIPGQFGVHSFIESGSVFVDVKPYNAWHLSYGGGLWMSYLDRLFNLSLTLAHSEEGYRVWAGTKLMF